ncbi:probable methyltransferase PMT27 [Dendrobium catenatum]|uniref:Methyltransferase n=1 Tax=Dendrobium catenatum TaxID=906689 RepID=A0A2I0XCR1_9ASPA|nr:probable methyltransferase PMT27 [Dendrobium catenatum]PKU85695.1 putative methyltransferase PMT27 [Dendrobium catenatum]
MKAFSKNSRGGKRGSSSYSSSASTAVLLIFVSLCLFAVYALTSSSSSSLLSLSQSSAAAEHRFLLKDIPQTGSVPPSEEDSSQNLDDEKQEEEKGNNGRQENLTKILIEEQSKIRDIDWDLCNVTAGPDYIPCLDNAKAIKKLNSLKHYEHRERHCPEESPTCLVPLPKGYKRSIEWPASRDKIWYNNVPRTKLAEVKGHQNWVKVDREYLIFPGGGTQFIHGALHYIDFIRQSLRDISWGKRIRVVLDVGCGVASFGGYLFERDVLTMSFAPKDEHEAQVQFALERGIPAISAVMGSHRLSFPSNVFDLIHCARCRVPWHADGGMLLLELNRVLRPGGYFVWSATPVYQKLKEDVGIWKAMTSLTISMCWDLVTIKKDKLNGIAAAIYRKPTTNECYDKRKNQNPPMCDKGDDPNAAWNVPLKTCMHWVPTNAAERGAKWPIDWPKRLVAPPYWLNASHIGIHGKPAPNDFKSDYEHWKNIVMKSYLNGLGINWSKLRNVMDMRSVYGGFAAALKDLKVWVMNVVNVDSPDTLPVIYERGLFGIYHDWCESFSTYPRTYDLLHADHLFSKLKERCSIVPVVAEIDRIARPGGKLVVRDESVVTSEVESLLKSLHWKVQLTFTKEKEGIITAEKSDWRPNKYSASS